MAWILRNWQASIYITVMITLISALIDLIRQEVRDYRNGK